MDGFRWIERQASPLRPRPFWRTVSECLLLWRDRARQRRQLATLDDRLLADIGIGRCDAMRECDKRFWED